MVPQRQPVATLDVLATELSDLIAEIHALRLEQAEFHDDVLHALSALQERREAAPAPADTRDARHARLLATLATAMDDLDLPIDSAEVEQLARTSSDLGDALHACGLT